ncbi:hypothetical protein [Variovorax boronicumulans]|uniref:hypothetical protein n=1 Tax=Variovorax boronicumulans TaxID=436515 RepID=UPI0012FE24A5|nr:hypothetical protein [Variovorax boronicumulans]
MPALLGHLRVRRNCAMEGKCGDKGSAPSGIPNRPIGKAASDHLDSFSSHGSPPSSLKAELLHRAAINTWWKTRHFRGSPGTGISGPYQAGTPIIDAAHPNLAAGRGQRFVEQFIVGRRDVVRRSS